MRRMKGSSLSDSFVSWWAQWLPSLSLLIWQSSSRPFSPRALSPLLTMATLANYAAKQIPDHLTKALLPP